MFYRVFPAIIMLGMFLSMYLMVRSLDVLDRLPTSVLVFAFLTQMCVGVFAAHEVADDLLRTHRRRTR